MLTKEQQLFNKQIYLDLINRINRDGFSKSEFIQFLESSDFFTAPASVKYHAAYEGGLCEHCLNVYYNMVTLASAKHMNLSDESIIITALCHDLSKVNFYRKETRNKKVDIDGKQVWQSYETYAVIPAEERFIYNNHETTAEYITRYYIPLSWNESTAIMHHMAGMSFDSVQGNIFSSIYGKNPLAVILHLADTMATYIDEGRNE